MSPKKSAKRTQSKKTSWKKALGLLNAYETPAAMDLSFRYQSLQCKGGSSDCTSCTTGSGVGGCGAPGVT